MSRLSHVTLTLLFLLSAATSKAQYQEQTLTIHRNSGSILYIPSQQVDSITGSYYDSTHQLQAEIVTLQIHTPDTLLRLSIAEIDSLTVGTLTNYCPDSHHPHAINMGLPSGTRWACCNIGAASPEGYGAYYAWGETEEKDTYSWDNYAYASYFALEEDHIGVDIGSDISNTQYDVAHMKWGGSWCMPSADDYSELLMQCQIAQATWHDTYGWLFTGPNGNSIFIPASGWKNYRAFIGPGSVAASWTSTADNDRLKKNAYFFSISQLLNSPIANTVVNNKFAGRTVRAVSK